MIQYFEKVFQCSLFFFEVGGWLRRNKLKLVLRWKPTTTAWRRPLCAAWPVSNNLSLWCVTKECYSYIRPYDEELLELLLMLEASEKSGEGGWNKLARKQAEEGIHRGRDNLREEDTFKEDIDFWPKQQMVSNQVRVLALLKPHSLLQWNWPDAPKQKL